MTSILQTTRRRDSGDSPARAVWRDKPRGIRIVGSTSVLGAAG
jgi:hypothetical protein